MGSGNGLNGRAVGWELLGGGFVKGKKCVHTTNEASGVAFVRRTLSIVPFDLFGSVFSALLVKFVERAEDKLSFKKSLALVFPREENICG